MKTKTLSNKKMKFCIGDSHVFFWAGDASAIPDDLPCACGLVTWENPQSIDKLLEKKSELEKRLGNIIASELSKFHDETGFSIESVHVEQLSVQTMGEKHPTYITGNVSCKIAFGGRL